MAIGEYIKGAVNYVSQLLQTVAGLTMAQWANFAIILGAVVSAGALLCAIIRDRKSPPQIKEDPGPNEKELQAHDPSNDNKWAKLTQSDQPRSTPI